VVVEIAARPVRNVAELLSQVAALQPGVASPVKILRGKKSLSLTVSPGVRPLSRQR
jgi:S1-C subfamily serine protease